MVWITLSVKIYTAFLLTTALCMAQPTTKDVDVTSLNEHVKKMDALLQEVQSHSQAQEQKYSAVLSSVLSQLTQTTEELSTSKNITEELQLEVQKVKEISNNTFLDYTAAMDELAELKQSQNKSLFQLSQITEELSTSKSITKELQLEVQTIKDINNNTLLDYTAAMDELAELKQSHKNTLSQLTQTTEELSASKNITEDLQLEVQKMKEINKSTLQEMAELKLSLNQTSVDYTTAFGVLTEMKQSHNKILMDLTGLKFSYNQSLVKLETVKSKVDSTQASLHKEIGFQAHLGKTINVSKLGKIVFDKVIHNAGNGYNTSTGTFTAPVSGSYLFWTNVVYRSNKTSVAFLLHRMETTFDSAYGMADEIYGRASATSIIYLKRGDIFWIDSKQAVTLRGYYTTAGAVLIKQY